MFSAGNAEPDSPRLDEEIAEIRITEAVWPKDRAPIARLMREYVEALDADISFQDFEAEHAGLPGKYARPEGVVLIALDGR